MAVVAIVGRPNVGKSTLFNLLIGENRAIVGPQRGITRDRLYGRWQLDEDTVVDLVDTGGFDTIPGGNIETAMRAQTLAAIKEADIILCVFDSRDGLTPDDQELVNLLRQAPAEPIWVANKVDDPTNSTGASQLYEIGVSDFVEISAKNRVGKRDLIALVSEKLKEREIPTTMPVDGAIRVSILGRPNVGKSMLTNRILGEERTIVSPVAGTTRDYIDIPVSLNGQDYVFVDTAGIRRKARIDDEIEKQSVIRSIRNVGMAHVCLFLIDPEEPMTEQDRRLCGIIMEQGKPFVVVVNKNDLLTQQDRKQVAHQLDFALKFMPDLRIVYISALTGRGVEKIMPLVNELYRKATFEAGTGLLNRILAKLTDSHNPPLVGNKRLKFFYVNQTGKVPPRFRIVCNRPDDVPDNYARYLINSLKKELDLEGIPLKVDFAGR